MDFESKKIICFIDCETTGLDSNYHEIIEFYGIKYLESNDRLIFIEDLHVKIKPVHEDRIDPEAIKVNGYSKYKWDKAIQNNVAASSIASFLQNHILCGHNVQFDVAFLSSLLNDHGFMGVLSRNHIDTKTLAYEHLVPCGLKGLSMDRIRNFMGWEVCRTHSARQDAIDVFKLYRATKKSSYLKRLFWRFRYSLS